MSKLIKSLSFCFFFLSSCLFSQENNLQMLVDQAKLENKEIVFLDRNKVYALDKPLVLYDNLKIEGNNATVTQSNLWSKNNERFAPLLQLINVRNIHLKNINFDHSAIINDEKNQPSYTILLLGAENCVIERCSFENKGAYEYSSPVKGNPFILIISQDKNNGFSYLPKDIQNKKFTSSNNIIEKCIFKNEKTYLSFAVRILTNWNDIDENSIIPLNVNNKIVNSLFIGEFDWNTIEVAGPGTRNTLISRNVINGKSLGNIDIDKGAKDNIVEHNIIINSGLPKRHFRKKNVRFAGITVQGFKGLYAENNIIRNNTIRNVKNSNTYQSQYLYSAGIAVYNSKNTYILKNKIDSLFEPSKYGVGILIDNYNEDLRIKGNQITNAYRGIYESLNVTNTIKTEIKENDIRVFKEKIFLKK